MPSPSLLTLALSASVSMASTATPTSAERAEVNVERLQINASQPLISRSLPAAITHRSTDAQLPGPRIDADELLQGIAGVQSDSRANYAQDTRISMRGFGARSAFGVRGVLLQLDGVPLSMPDGQAQTSSILLDEPDNVQIIRGPLAVLYGNAAGGVIHWQSAAPQATTSTLNVAQGANALIRTQAHHDWHENEQALRIIASHFRTDGPRAHNQARRSHVAGRWYRQLSPTTQLILRYDNSNAPLLEDPGALTPDDWRNDPSQTIARASTYNTRKAIQHEQLSTSITYQEDAHAADITLWRGWRAIEQYLPFQGDDLTSSGAVIDLKRDFIGIHSDYHWTPSTLPDWQLSAGFQLAQQNDRRFGFVNNFGEKGALRRNEDSNVEAQSAYVLSNWQLAPRWQWLLGTRYQHTQFTVNDSYITPDNPDDSGRTAMQDWSWMSGLHYQLTPSWSVYLSRGAGFETPTLTEMAYRNNATGLNTELKPARNLQWEIGQKWQRHNLQAQLVGYHITTYDELVVDQSIDGRTTYKNAAETERQGLELDLQLSFTPHWTTQFNAHALDATYSDGRRLPGVAERQAYWQFEWQPSSAHQVRLIGSYRGTISANEDMTVIAPSATLWHLAYQGDWRWQDLELGPWLKLHNLTDRDYVGAVVVNQGSGRAFEPGVGRELQAGITIRYVW